MRSPKRTLSLPPGDRQTDEVTRFRARREACGERRAPGWRPPRKRKIRGTGGKDKAKVLGMIERGGEIRVRHVEDLDRKTVHGFVREGVESGSNVYSDSARSFSGLDADYAHETVDHAECYVDGQVHTNYIENFWALLKRGLHGTYVSVEPFHLFRYLDERVFTFNLRELDDLGRFESVLRTVAGRRLTYADVTGH